MLKENTGLTECYENRHESKFANFQISDKVNAMWE